MTIFLLVFVLAGCGAPDPVAAVRELQTEGRFEESLEPLRELLAARPDDPEVQYLHGLALVQTGHQSLALWSLLKAMESREWLVPAGLALAAGALTAGNHELAVEAASRILEAEPENLEALLLRAHARVGDRRHYEEALEDADRALEIDPGNADALVPRAVALLGLERVEAAEAALADLDRAFREADPGETRSDRYCAARALFQRTQGDSSAAEQTLRKCLEDYPASHVVVQQAVEFYDGQADPGRANEILRKALETEHGAGAYRPMLASRLRQAGAVEEAERLLQEGTQAGNPTLAMVAWVDLSDHYLKVEDYAKAASALEHAMGLGGDQDPMLRFRYADVLVMAGRHDDAIELARGMQVPAHRDFVMGRVALEQDKPGEALERFTAGLLLWPNNAVARYYAALAAERTGDFDRAISEYRYAIRAEPGATDAGARLARLHEAEGAYEFALAAALNEATEATGRLDADLVRLRVLARLGRASEARNTLSGLATSNPAGYGRAVAAAAEGAAARRGPLAGAHVLQRAERLDLEDPKNAAALRALVSLLGEAGESAGALEVVKAALAKHPEAAAFHEIHGRALEASQASDSAVRAAYERAVELDADHSALATAGLARLAARAGNEQAALDLYARAAATDGEDPSPLRAWAELLVSMGRRDEAEQRLAEALERDPYDAGSAARLAELVIEKDAELDRALQLARRAVRFGGGAAAHELLARVHERRGEADLAREALAGAEAARERRSAGR